MVASSCVGSYLTSKYIAVFYMIMRRTKQAELPLHRGRWRGRRPGAGRKCGPNPAVRHLSREKFAERFPCHVTLKVRPDLPSLRQKRVVREIERSFAKGCERGSFRVVHYSIQSDHAHFVVEASGREALGRGMKSLAARFARAVNRALGRAGRVLADRYHLRVLRTPREVRNALAYVLLNARRHLAQQSGRGAVRGDGIDPASSGRWFDGWKSGGAASPGDPTAAAVAAAHTWLLRVGWRRHGLIAASEIPGTG